MKPEDLARAVVDRLPALVQEKNRLSLVETTLRAYGESERQKALEDAAALVESECSISTAQRIRALAPKAEGQTAPENASGSEQKDGG